MLSRSSEGAAGEPGVTEETLICGDGIVRTAVLGMAWTPREELLTLEQVEEAESDAVENIWAVLHAGVVQEMTTGTGIK